LLGSYVASKKQQLGKWKQKREHSKCAWFIASLCKRNKHVWTNVLNAGDAGKQASETAGIQQ